MVRFDYLEPRSLRKACQLLDRYGDDARPMAGGTALIIWMRQRLLNPRVIISLAQIPNFDRVQFNPRGGLRIGAGTRHRDIEHSPAVRPALSPPPRDLPKGSPPAHPQYGDPWGQPVSG